MPTLEHSGLVGMFRERPSLAPHLLAIVFQAKLPPHASVRVADSALDQPIPLEFRADLVLELVDDAGKAVLATVLEVQRDRDRRKRYTWPVYWAVARAERECPAVVLVVAPNAEVAGWAGQKVDMGLGRASIEPLVLGPSTVPVVTDPAQAMGEVELSILSAMAHGNGPEGLAVVEAAFVALKQLDDARASVYFQIIWKALREPMRRALERWTMDPKLVEEARANLPPFLKELIERNRLEREGMLKGKRETLLRQLARKEIVLTEEEQARIQGCDDLRVLDRWLDNILVAKTAADVLT